MEELIDVLSDLGDSGLWPKDRIKKLGQMNELRSQLLPLIRSGLALQRLEKWQDDGPGRECHREIIDGMVHIRLLVRDKLVAFGVSVTASKAINAALDAAGVE